MLPSLAQLSLNTKHTDGLTDKRSRNDSSPVLPMTAPTAMDRGREFCVLLKGQSRCMNAYGNRSDLLPSRDDVKKMLIKTEAAPLGDTKAYTEVLKHAVQGGKTIALVYKPTNGSGGSFGSVVAAAVLGTAFNSPSEWLEKIRGFYGYFWSLRGTGAMLRQGDTAKWQDALDELTTQGVVFEFHVLCATHTAGTILVANAVKFVNAQFIEPTLKIAKLEEWSGAETVVGGRTVAGSKGAYAERINAMSLFRALPTSPPISSFWSNNVEFTLCPRQGHVWTALDSGEWFPVYMRYVNLLRQPEPS